MAVQNGSNVLRNPFANARAEPSNFNEPGKRSPTDGTMQRQPGDTTQNRSITNVDDNPDFVADNGQPAKPKSDDPIDNLDSLWDDPVIDPKAPKPKVFEGYLPKIDPTKFAEQVGQVDFAGKIDPKHLQAVAKGGDEAVAAMAEIINGVGRQAFSMSFNAASRMTDAASKNVESRFMEDLIPNQINNRIVDDTLTGSNEMAKNPKFAALFSSVKNQLKLKHPKATPQQIAEAANAYMADYAKTATTPKEDAPNNTKLLKQGAEGANWEEWLKP